MLSADLLFDLREFSHASLFAGDRPVWSALQDLKNYMDSYAYTKHLFSRLADGVAAREHLVLHAGELIEANRTDELFTRPHNQRTEDYITGRFG